LIFLGTFTAEGLLVECQGYLALWNIFVIVTLKTLLDGKLKIIQEGKSKKFVKQLLNVDFNASEGLAKGQDVHYYTGIQFPNIFFQS
jgi:hypothetical protein